MFVSWPGLKPELSTATAIILCMGFSLTVCIRIVADCGTQFFQVTSKVYAEYNVHVYYYFGYYFYTLLPAGIFVYLFVIIQVNL